MPRKTRQKMDNTLNGIQLAGKNNKVVQIIRVILNNAGPDKKKVKNALDTYINTLLTDKNRIPLEFILDPDDRIRFETVPLPAVFTELDVVYRFALSHWNFNDIDQEQEYEEGDGSKEGNSENQPIAAVQAVAENRQIVIVGDPGAGKTTLINYLCVIMASMLINGGQDVENRLNRDSNSKWNAREILFPISIRLRDFGQSKLFWKYGEGNASNLAHYIAEVVVGEYNETDVGPAIRAQVIELLTRGGALIVMDGLDELPGEAYEVDATSLPDERDQQHFRKTAKTRMRLQRILNSFTEHPEYGKCRVVVTSRSYAYRSTAEWRLGPHFAEAHLRDFEPKQIQEYIHYWHLQIAERKAKQSQRKADQAEPAIDYQTIEETVSSFWQALENNKHMLELARRPLILTFIVSRYSSMERRVKSLPSVSKVNLYGDIVRMLTKFWSRHQIESDPHAPDTLVDALGLQNDDQLELLLSVVAFEAQRGMEDFKSTGSAVITSDTLRHAWEKIGVIFNVGTMRKDVWMRLRERTGILLPYRTDDDGTEYFAFTHPSFQEWLAAKAIMSRSPKILPIEYWPEEYRRNPAHLTVPDLVAGLVQVARERWQEVIALILELMIYVEPDTTWQIIGGLVADPVPELPEDNRWYGAFLAGDFLKRNKEVINDADRPEPEVLRTWLARSLQYQAMSLEERDEVGRILAVLGDVRVQLRADPVSRFDEYIWSPDHANTMDNLWVCVPDALIRVGSPPQDREGQRRERSEERRPANCEREVQGFYMSRYHVTSDMFQCFIRDGYNRHDCWNWSKSSWQWHESNLLPEPGNQMPLGNAPCRMVSWYEAMAFCRWLTLINPFHLEVFLPGESEWLAAACSDPKGRFHDKVYLWGDAFEGQPAHLNWYGNIRRLRLNAICSVGIFRPNRLGIFDMSGNVAEWTRSVWRSDLALTENNDLENLPQTQRAVRGCSYRDIDVDIRVGHRRGLSPGQRFNDIGFRIAARVRNQ